MFIGERPNVPVFDKLYIDNYSGGDQVGSINIQVLRRHVDNMVGYFNYRGMKLTTIANYETVLSIQNGQNPVANPVENSDFKDNYFILIGTTYYQMSDINGQDIYLTGPVQNWGLLGETVGLGYTILQLVNQPITIQDGRTGQFETFDFIDRRGDGSFFITEDDSPMPMAFRLDLLNNPENNVQEHLQTKEKIVCHVQFKE
jgi:hypothetical protein